VAPGCAALIRVAGTVAGFGSGFASVGAPGFRRPKKVNVTLALYPLPGMDDVWQIDFGAAPHEARIQLSLRG
jgi:hypothetical protein